MSRSGPGLVRTSARISEGPSIPCEKGVVPGSPWPGRLGERGVKRILLKRFPLSVVFVDTGSGKVVLAVAHHRRRPAYWRGRVSRTGLAR